MAGEMVMELKQPDNSLIKRGGSLSNIVREEKKPGNRERGKLEKRGTGTNRQNRPPD